MTLNRASGVARRGRSSWSAYRILREDIRLAIALLAISHYPESIFDKSQAYRLGTAHREEGSSSNAPLCRANSCFQRVWRSVYRPDLSLGL